MLDCPAPAAIDVKFISCSNNHNNNFKINNLSVLFFLKISNIINETFNLVLPFRATCHNLAIVLFGLCQIQNTPCPATKDTNSCHSCLAKIWHMADSHCCNSNKLRWQTNNFLNSFTSKFLVKWLFKILSYVSYVSTLPCEIFLLKNCWVQVFSKANHHVRLSCWIIMIPEKNICLMMVTQINVAS